MINEERLARRIKKHEGYSPKVYTDQLGHPTIGFGHLIKKGENFKKNKKYSKKYLNTIFKKDLYKAIKNYNKYFVKHKFTPEVEGVIIEMMFQLGPKRFLKFKKMIKALKKRDFLNASREMINSKWKKQTPERVRALTKILITPE